MEGTFSEVSHVSPVRAWEVGKTCKLGALLCDYQSERQGDKTEPGARWGSLRYKDPSLQGRAETSGDDAGGGFVACSQPCGENRPQMKPWILAVDTIGSQETSSPSLPQEGPETVSSWRCHLGKEEAAVVKF